MNEDTRTHDEVVWRAVLPLAVGTGAWAASLALAKFGPHLWGANPALGWAAVGLNIAVGVVWVIVHVRYLRRIDELQRKILVDALAVALGAGVVLGLAFAAARDAGLVAFDADIGRFTILVGVTYLISVAVGTVRFR